MSPTIAAILGFVGALTLTILLYVFVIPEKKDGKFGNKFWQLLHNIFNFKSLLIEVILKFCYVFGTLFIIVYGFFLLFSMDGYGYYRESMALPGLLMLILGPIGLRLMYEGVMMLIILVKKVISIDNKLKVPEETKKAPKAPRPAPQPKPRPAPRPAPQPVPQPAPQPEPQLPPLEVVPEVPAEPELPQIEEAPTADAPVVTGYDPFTGEPIYGEKQ